MKQVFLVQVKLSPWMITKPGIKIGFSEDIDHSWEAYGVRPVITRQNMFIF